MEEIYRDIIKITNKHSNNNGGVICDIGIRDTGINYVFIDVGLGLGRRKSIDNAKVLFMNECMELLGKLQRYIESPLDTVDTG